MFNGALISWSDASASVNISGVIFVALAGWGAVSIAELVVRHFQPPSLSSQLSTILRKEAERSWVSSYDAPLDLHGVGQTSRVLILRWSPAGGSSAVPGGSGALRSDEIRVYDVRGGRFRLAFSYEPRLILQDKRYPTGNPTSIRVVSTEDVDLNGGRDLITSFDEDFGDELIAHPVVIRWSDATQRYSVVPLLDAGLLGSGNQRVRNRPPSLASLRHPTTLTEYAHRLYSQAVTFADARGARFSSYGAEDFIIEPTASHHFDLVAGYISGLTPTQAGTRLLLQVKGFWLNFPQTPFNVADECDPSSATYLRTPFGNIADALQRRWSQVKATLDCS